VSLLGTSAPRVDARKKVMGRAEYTAEILMPGMTYAVLVGSSIANGRIEQIDTTAAERAPGVVLVLTHVNRGPLAKMPSGADGSVMMAEPRPPLEDDKIRYYGQYVAVVMAETFEQAQFAASLVDVRYRAAPPIVSLLDPRAIRLVPPMMLGQPLQVQRGNPHAVRSEGCGKQHGDYAAGASAADVFVAQTYTSSTEHATAMEPHAVVSTWNNGELVVYTSTQWVDGDQRMLCSGLQLPADKVRVLSPYVGGAFGSKIATPWAVMLASIATIRIGRPVKLVLSRQQVITTIGHRTGSLQDISLCASRDGTLLAMRHHTVTHSIVEDGYPDDAEYIEPTSMASRMLYACPNYASSHELVRLNAMKPTWMRAPGENLCMWAVESAMDELAIAAKIDPIELRRKNHADTRPGDGKPWSSKNLLACYDRGARRFGWARRDPEPGAMRDGPTQIGWGMATATYVGVTLGATVRLRIEPLDGGILATVSSAASDMGQGAYAMMSIAAADSLGVPLDRVKVELGDTSLPPCGAAGASGLTSSVAPAIKDAAQILQSKLLVLAARAPNGFPDADQHPDDFVFRAGQIEHRSNSKAITFAELLAFAKVGNLEAEATTQVVFGETDQFAVSSFGAVFVEVRVDRDIGKVRVARVVGVYDVGKVISATTTRSQLMGGVVWGIGEALFEGFSYDPNKGMPVNPDFAGYLVPTHADIPEDIDVSWLDEPDFNHNAIGCRGTGEIGITGVSAAIANAIHHATGVRIRKLPIALEALL
jgi:xanthine dehydrogenase YagR molybdenum-binding subunit